jgi:hypothetical protein
MSQVAFTVNAGVNLLVKNISKQLGWTVLRERVSLVDETTGMFHRRRSLLGINQLNSFAVDA